MFLVPYNKLSEDQKAIIRRVSRESNDLFVKGPPGSGKTLISLYTLKDMVENQAMKPLLLIYNHSLYGYLTGAMKELDLSDNITIATKDKFFWDLAKIYNIRPQGKSYEDKYISLLDGLAKVRLDRDYDIAVVDEVQDLRKEEWALIKKITKRITSLGDFDQGVYNTNLSEAEVTQRSNIERLRDIFRFHKNIAKVAQFFAKSNDSLEDKVSRIEQKDVQLIEVLQGNEASTVAEIIGALKKQQGRIGIISHSHEKLQTLQNSLKSFGIKSSYYVSNRDLRSHDFTSEEPLLVTSFSAKGLEFEHVIVFGFDEDDSRVSSMRSQGQLKDILYVTLTRTNSNLYILRSENTIKELSDITLEEDDDNFDLDDLF